MTDNVKMDPEAKALWLSWLRDPQHSQTKGHLFEDRVDYGIERGYCCLGLFAKAKGATFFRTEIECGDDEGDTEVRLSDDFTVEVNGWNGDINTSEQLNQDWADKFGISKSHQDLLAALNDGILSYVRHDDPLLDVWRAVTNQDGIDTRQTGKLRFEVTRLGFAAIANVIDTHF